MRWWWWRFRQYRFRWHRFRWHWFRWLVYANCNPNCNPNSNPNTDPPKYQFKHFKFGLDAQLALICSGKR